MKKRKIYVSKERIKSALKEAGVSLHKLCDETGLNYETIRPCVAKQMIMPDDLETIAKRLDVSVSFLQGKTEEKIRMNLKEAYRLVYQDLIRRGGYRIGIYRYIGAYVRWSEGAHQIMREIAFFAGKEDEYSALYNANEQESLPHIMNPENIE